MGISFMQNLAITVDQQSYPVLSLPGRPKAILDRTVAEIYGVETKRVNEAVSRNPEKFPMDFFFQLNFEEFELVANCDQFHNIKYSSTLPKAFTWEGCNMLATILKSEIAIKRAIQIIRAFTSLERIGYSFREEFSKLIEGDRYIIKALVNALNNSEIEIEDLKKRVSFLENRFLFTEQPSFYQQNQITSSPNDLDFGSNRKHFISKEQADVLKKPDIVCLSNVLLSGLARSIKSELGVHVVCLLQDESEFVDAMEPQYAEKIWSIIRDRCGDIDVFISVSRYYEAVMRQKLELPESKMRVVYVGVSVADFYPQVEN